MFFDTFRSCLPSSEREKGHFAISWPQSKHLLQPQGFLGLAPKHFFIGVLDFNGKTTSLGSVEDP